LFFLINPGQGGDDIPTTLELLAGLGEEAPDEFEVEADEEGGGTADVAAVEVEDGTDAEHDAAAEMRTEALHELLLLGGAEGYPDDIHPLLCQRGSNGGVIKILDLAEGERREGHIRHGGVPGGESGAEVGQGGIIRAEEGHAVLPYPDDIAENLGAAVLLPLYAIEPPQVEGHPRAVADGEHGLIHRGAVGGVLMHEGQDVAIGHADVARALRVDSLANVPVHSRRVELIAYLEVGFHGESGCFLILPGFVAAQAFGFGVFGGGGEGVRALGDAVVQDYFVEGEEEDFDIQPRGEFAGVAQVVRDALAEGEVVAPVHLGEAGDAGADAHTVAPGAGVEGGHLLGYPGAGADEAHVAQQHVDEFRQFIQRGGAQEFAHPGGAFFIRQELAFRITCVGHGAEFDDVEGQAAAADAFLQEEGVAALEEQQHHEEEQQERGEGEQHEQRGGEVYDAFAGPLVECAGRRQLVQQVDFLCYFHFRAAVVLFEFLILCPYSPIKYYW